MSKFKYLVDTAEELALTIKEKSSFAQIWGTITAIPFILMFIGAIAFLIGFLPSFWVPEMHVGDYLAIFVISLFGLLAATIMAYGAIHRIKSGYSATHSTLEVGLEGVSKRPFGKSKDHGQKLRLTQIEKVQIELLGDGQAHLRVLPKSKNNEELAFEELPVEEAKELKVKIETVLEGYKLPPA